MNHLTINNLTVFFLLWIMSNNGISVNHQLEYIFEPMRREKDHILNVKLIYRVTDSYPLPSFYIPYEDKNNAKNPVIRNIRRIDTSPKLSRGTRKTELLYEIHSTIEKHAYDPVIKKEGFLFIGEKGLIKPIEPPNKKINIKITWKVPHKDFYIINKYAQFSFNQAMHATLEDLGNSVFAGGDLQFYQTNHGCMDLQLIFFGKTNLPNRELEKKISNILMAQCKYFDEPCKGNRQFYISVNSNMASNQIIARALSNNYLIIVPPCYSDFNSLLSVLSHEHIHNWLGGKLIWSEKKEAEQKWFFEGFTEYIAKAINVKNGIINEAQYQEEYKNTLKSYLGSPLRNKPLSFTPITEAKKSELHKLQYWKGELFAHYINQKIQRLTQGKRFVHNLIFHMIKSCEENNCTFSDELFETSYHKITGSSCREDLNLYIYQGKTIPLENKSTF